MATKTIYILNHQLDGGMYWEFFSTKGLAYLEAGRVEKEALETGEYKKGEAAMPSVSEFEVDTTNSGLANAFNHFCSMLCVNEF